MYATLHNHKLTTPGYNGEQFIIHVDGPGIYQVRTCTTRGDVVEFGSGIVKVELYHLPLHILKPPPYQLRIEDHKVEILTYITY